MSSTLSNRSAYRPPSTHFCSRATRARGQQVGEREEPALTPVEHVQVLDSLVDLAVLELAQPIAVFAFEQDADERVQEVQVLGGWLQRERVDADVALSQAELHVAAVKERRQLPVAVPQVQDDRERVVLLGVRDQEVQKEALAAARSRRARACGRRPGRAGDTRTACWCGVSNVASGAASSGEPRLRPGRR